VTETFSPKNNLITSPNVLSDGGVSFQGNHTTKFEEGFKPKHFNLSGFSDEKIDRKPSHKQFKNEISDNSCEKEFRNSACQT